MTIPSTTSELTSLKIIGHVLYLNGDERYPIQLGAADIWNPKNIEELVILFCSQEYDEVNYVSEENVRKLASLAFKEVIEGQSLKAERHTISNKTVEFTNEIYFIDQLSDIDDPKYAHKFVRLRAIVSTSTVSYNVPKELEVSCSAAGEHKCAKNRIIRLSPHEIARYPDTKGRDKLNEFFAQAHFTHSCRLDIKEISDTLYRVRVRPNLSSLIFQNGKMKAEEEGTEYKHYDICILGKHVSLEPGSVYEITGVVIPDPRSQRVTLFAIKIAADLASEYDMSKLLALKSNFQGKAVKDQVDWIVRNFQKYSKVRKREDVIKANLLTFFSPQYIEFDGKRERGWLICAAIGDSTTGKSEVSKHMIRLTDGGQYIVAETASMVGLSATATQTSNGWFVEWGPLVLGDRRLIVIDGAQKLSKYDWSTLAESQRLGQVRLTKAAKGEAHARTRQVIIANPVDLENYGSTKEMGAFYYPYVAIATIMDTITIARLDLAVFVQANDVTAEDINQALDEETDPLLFNYKDLRAFVWESKFKIEYDSEFVRLVHEKATELYNKFSVKNVPLISIDMKYKLSRMSIALALATCSFNDTMETLVVSKDHVHYIAGLIDELYTAAGLHEGAQRNKDNEVDEAHVENLIYNIHNKTELEEPRIKKILTWMAQQASFSKDQLKAKFELAEKNELNPLVSLLQVEGVIVRGRAFSLSMKGVKVVRLITERNG